MSHRLTLKPTLSPITRIPMRIVVLTAASLLALGPLAADQPTSVQIEPAAGRAILIEGETPDRQLGSLGIGSVLPAASVRLLLIGTNGKAVGQLAKADFPEAKAAARWPADKANAWYDAAKWPVGANFVPSTAINQLEMWQADTFDPETIDRELGWAASIGMNTMRVFLHDIPHNRSPPVSGVRLPGWPCPTGSSGSHWSNPT
jgi:hypothetical protein